jgi:hypothetical protein
MCLPPSLLVERATIATQTDDPVIPILPLAKPFYYNVEVIREEWGTWRCHSGIQTDDLREPIMTRVNKRNHPSLLKRYLDEFNQEEFPRSNPKRVYIPSSRARSHDTPNLRIDSQREKSVLCPDPIPVIRDDGPVSEPFIDLSLGNVTKNFVRRMRMNAVIDHYEANGMIRGIHIMTLQGRFSKDFVSEKKYSIPGIRELLRSKGFGIDKYDRVKNFKK